MITSARSFADLEPAIAYAVWRLRQDVFVVEQDCPYPDLDGRDDEPGTRHVLLLEGDDLLGYARVLDDQDVWRIGRVVLARSARGRGLADHVMGTALRGLPRPRRRPRRPVTAGRLVRRLRVRAHGDEFLEDGIPHTPMRLSR